MIVISKMFRMLSGGCLLFLGIFSMPQGSDLASAAEDVKRIPCEVPHGQNATRAEHVEKQGTHMISGEVIRIEDTSIL